MLLQNLATPFAANLADSIGYPHWNSAQQLEDFPVITIPYFGSSDNEINGVMYNFRVSEGDWMFTFATREIVLELIEFEIEEVNIPFYGITNEKFNDLLFGDYDEEFYQVMIDYSTSQDSLLFYQMRAKYKIGVQPFHGVNVFGKLSGKTMK